MLASPVTAVVFGFSGFSLALTAGAVFSDFIVLDSLLASPVAAVVFGLADLRIDFLCFFWDLALVLCLTDLSTDSCSSIFDRFADFPSKCSKSGVLGANNSIRGRDAVDDLLLTDLCDATVVDFTSSLEFMIGVVILPVKCAIALGSSEANNCVLGGSLETGLAVDFVTGLELVATIAGVFDALAVAWIGPVALPVKCAIAAGLSEAKNCLSVFLFRCSAILVLSVAFISISFCIALSVCDTLSSNWLHSAISFSLIWRLRTDFVSLVFREVLFFL